MPRDEVRFPQAPQDLSLVLNGLSVTSLIKNIIIQGRRSFGLSNSWTLTGLGVEVRRE